jgi:hypothetical protein
MRFVLSMHSKLVMRIRRRLQRIVLSDGIGLNFFGSIVGWCVAYVVLQHACSPDGFRPVDLPLAFMAFVGMTGHLPYVVKHVWKWQFPWPSSGDPKKTSEN